MPCAAPAERATKTYQLIGCSPNVVAVGVGLRTRGGQPTSEVCIVVSVTAKVPAAQLKRGDLLPASIDGVPIDVVETGALRAW